MYSEMKLINLKKARNLIRQYVDLRNIYSEFLLTSAVNIPETEAWLERDDIEIRGFVEQDILLGVAILYISKKGEVAFFVRDKGKGIGSTLLIEMEKVAKEKGLTSIWAWVLRDNAIAQKVFKKNGFVRSESDERLHKDKMKQGIRYEKNI